MTTAPHPQLHRAQPAHNLLSPFILQQIDTIDIRAGQRVMDIGAGTGDITTHLAVLVGPTGTVAAVDDNTRYLNPTNIIDVYHRDLATDLLPGEPDTFDGIVARRLGHHTTWPDALVQMVIRLRPGGWLILADITDTPPQVYRATNADDAELIRTVMHTIHANLLLPGGKCAEDIDTLLASSGMHEVHTRISLGTWTGGSSGCALLAGIAAELRDVLPEGDLAQFTTLMANPRIAVRSYARRAIHARKPT